MRVLSRALQAATERLDAAAGGWGGNGATPPIPMQRNVDAAKGWSTEQIAAAEAAERAHHDRYPWSAPCVCGCRRWETGATRGGERVWVCVGCHRAYQALGPGAIVRPGSAPAPAWVAPSPTEARRKLEASRLELAEARAEYERVIAATDAARSAVVQAEQTAEVAEAALTSATAGATTAMAAALRGRRAAPPVDLGKCRDYVAKAADALHTAREAQRQIVAEAKESKKAAERAERRAGEAARQVLAADLPPAVTYLARLRDDFLKNLAELRSLVATGVTTDADARDLAELHARPPREWPGGEAAALRASAAIEAKLAALVSGDAT